MADRRPLSKRIGYWLIRNLTRAMDGLARILPLSWLRAVGTAAAYLIYLLFPSRQRLARENLRKAFGDRFSPAQRRTIARQATINICHTMVELLKMRYMSPAQIRALVSLQDEHYLHQVLGEGKGAVVITAHFGNWELGGARFAAEGFAVTVLARDPNEHFTAELINQARQHHNIEVIGRDDLRSMIRTLRDNRGLGILPDQHAAEGGIVVHFLGRSASTATGPAILALRTGSPIVPFFTQRRPDGSLQTRVLPPVDLPETDNRDEFVRQVTQRINDVIGHQISQQPQQWLWLHDRWKADRDKPGS